MLEFTLNTRKIYKIWFSIKPHLFMNQENQLRFVRLRNKNPEAEISLVYSSKLLNENAKQDLSRFCNLQKITPVDFDTTIYNAVVARNSEQDLKLYALAKDELDNIGDDGHGNPSAASNYVRILRDCIALGIYTDTDVDVEFLYAPAHLPVPSPFLLNCNAKITPEGTRIVANDDILCFGEYAGQNETRRAETPIYIDFFIDNYQKVMLKNCSNAYEELKKVLMMKGISLNHLPDALATDYNPENMTPRQFRQLILKTRIKNWMNEIVSRLSAEPDMKNFVSTKTKEGSVLTAEEQDLLDSIFMVNIKNILSANDLKEIMGYEPENESTHYFIIQYFKFITQKLIMSSVIAHAGPNALLNFIAPDYEYSELIEKTSIYKTDVKFYIFSINNQGTEFPITPQISEQKKLDQRNPDNSWMPVGQMLIKLREAKMVESARKIQLAYRSYRQTKNNDDRVKPVISPKLTPNLSELNRMHLVSSLPVILRDQNKLCISLYKTAFLKGNFWDETIAKFKHYGINLNHPEPTCKSNWLDGCEHIECSELSKNILNDLKNTYKSESQSGKIAYKK